MLIKTIIVTVFYLILFVIDKCFGIKWQYNTFSFGLIVGFFINILGEVGYSFLEGDDEDDCNPSL